MHSKIHRRNLLTSLIASATMAVLPIAKTDAIIAKDTSDPLVELWHDCHHIFVGVSPLQGSSDWFTTYDVWIDDRRKGVLAVPIEDTRNEMLLRQFLTDHAIRMCGPALSNVWRYEGG